MRNTRIRLCKIEVSALYSFRAERQSVCEFALQLRVFLTLFSLKRLEKPGFHLESDDSGINSFRVEPTWSCHRVPRYASKSLNLGP